MAQDHHQDKWLERLMGRTHRKSGFGPLPPGVCIDADILAAWVDGALNASEAAAVELHASSCSRCQSLLAAMARTAPAGEPAKPAWTPARVVRWVLPLAAVATAVAIWVAVPDRTITNVRPATIPEAAMSAPDVEPGNREPEGRRLADAEPVPEKLQSEPSPAGQLLRERGVDSPERKELPDARREKPAARSTAAAAREAASGPPVPPAAPASQGMAGTLKEPLAMAPQSAQDKSASPIESVSASDPLIRWRVTSGTLVERSTDGGKSWTKTASPPAVITAIQVLDSARATVTTADGRTFSTSDAGASWTQVQEKQAAPF